MPKRKDELRRRNAVPEGEEVTTLDISKLPDHILQAVEMPDADPSWHSIARMMYDSLQHSGTKVFYEPSDWATAYLLAENLSRALKPQWIVSGKDELGNPEGEFIEVPLKGVDLAAYLKGFGSLGATEGDRRRMRIEIKRVPEGPAAPVAQLGSVRDNLLG